MKKTCLLFTILFYLVGKAYSQNSESQTFTIETCIEYAFQNSPFLKAREAELEIAHKNEQIIKGMQLPKLKTTISTQLTDRYQDFDQATTGSIELLQAVWQNGRLRTLANISEEDEKITGLNYSIERMNLNLLIRQQCLNLLRLQQMELLAKEMAKRIAVNVESAKERYQVGVARKSDILKAETELSNSIFNVSRFITERKVAEKNLLKSMGADFGEQINISNTLKEVDFSYLSRSQKEFFKKAEQLLPELQIADLTISKQKSIINLEQQSAFPEINLSAAYSFIDTPVQKGDWLGSVGAAVNISIFNGNERKHKIAKESIRLNQLEYKKDDLVNLIELEIGQAYLELVNAKEQIDNSLKQLENSAENLEIVREEYKLGLSSMLELLDAENTDFVANQNYIQALSDYHFARVLLERKSGIGTR